MEFHIFVKGKVQGVGFRRAIKDMALEANLTGYVKNLSDGRVEVCIQGEEKSVKSFIQEIGSLKFEIDSVEVKKEKSQRMYNSFQIAY